MGIPDRANRQLLQNGEAPTLRVPGLQCEGCQLRHGKPTLSENITTYTRAL